MKAGRELAPLMFGPTNPQKLNAGPREKMG